MKAAKQDTATATIDPATLDSRSALDKADAASMLLGRAWGLAAMLHGQVGEVRAPIDCNSQLATLERIQKLVAAAEGGAADVSLRYVDVTARLIATWLQGDDRICDDAMGFALYDLVEQLEDAKHAIDLAAH